MTFESLLPALFSLNNFEAATQHPQTTAGILFIAVNRTSPGSSCQDFSFIRELCRLSLKVFSHANSLIRLYTLPNFFSFKQRISQKGKTCSRIWNPRHFSLSEEVTLHVRIRLQAGKTMTVLFFRNAFEKLSCEHECAALSSINMNFSLWRQQIMT